MLLNLNKRLIFHCWVISKYLDKENLKDVMEALYQSGKDGNDKIEQIVNLKQLQANIYKSSFLLGGPRKSVQEIRKLIKENPLTIN